MKKIYHYLLGILLLSSSFQNILAVDWSESLATQYEDIDPKTAGVADEAHIKEFIKNAVEIARVEPTDEQQKAVRDAGKKVNETREKLVENIKGMRTKEEKDDDGKVTQKGGILNDEGKTLFKSIITQNLTDDQKKAWEDKEKEVTEKLPNKIADLDIKIKTTFNPDKKTAFEEEKTKCEEQLEKLQKAMEESTIFDVPFAHKKFMQSLGYQFSDLENLKTQKYKNITALLALGDSLKTKKKELQEEIEAEKAKPKVVIDQAKITRLEQEVESLTTKITDFEKTKESKEKELAAEAKEIRKQASVEKLIKALVTTRFVYDVFPEIAYDTEEEVVFLGHKFKEAPRPEYKDFELMIQAIEGDKLIQPVSEKTKERVFPKWHQKYRKELKIGGIVTLSVAGAIGLAFLLYKVGAIDWAYYKVTGKLTHRAAQKIAREPIDLETVLATYGKENAILVAKYRGIH